MLSLSNKLRVNKGLLMKFAIVILILIYPIVSFGCESHDVDSDPDIAIETEQKSPVETEILEVQDPEPLYDLPEGAISVPHDYSTIQDAIDSAEDGDIIIVAPGTYQENINFLGKEINLQSIDPDNLEIVSKTIIDGGNSGSVVTFRNGESNGAILSGFTITGGSGQREKVEYEYEGVIKVSKDAILGGGILVWDDCSPVINNNIIKGNTASDGGGIIALLNSSPTIEGNTITDNESRDGGGIAIIFGSSPIIKGNSITGNRAYNGGGIFIGYNAQVLVRDNNIMDNKSDAGGGGVYLSYISITEIEGNTIQGNQAAYGGAICSSESSPHVKANMIINNETNYLGGGIYVVLNPSPLIEGNTIKDNSSEEGGGIALEYGTSPAIQGNIFETNMANKQGGAIWVSNNSDLNTGDPDENIYSGNSPDDIYQE